MIIVVLGLLTLSRNFVLAIAVYFLIEKFSKSRMLFKLIKKVGFIGMTLIAVVLLIGLESTFISSEPVYAQNDFDRFYNVVDASNNDRLTANVLLRESLSESPINYFFGVDKDLYTENIFRNTSAQLTFDVHCDIWHILYNYYVFCNAWIVWVNIVEI